MSATETDVRPRPRSEERIESLEGQLVALVAECRLWQARATAAEELLERARRRVEELERNP